MTKNLSITEKEISEKFAKAQDSLVVQQSDFSLATIQNMVSRESIDITPHYQRRDRWTAEKQSALIESFLLNVPVPPVYLSEDDYGSYSVIDGKQRITAICDFLEGRLKLKNLNNFTELENYSFNDLPVQLKNVLNVRPFIRVITLLKQSDAELKYEVFLRLNTGGEHLKRQEIRNVAYAGKLNDLLFELSENSFLKERMKINSDKSSAYRSMDDLEHVLRFFTIRDNWENMGSILGNEMDKFMAENKNIDDSCVNKFRDIFNTAINRCEYLWKDKAFYKPVNSSWRTQLISPLYDAEMVGVSLLSDEQYNRIVSGNKNAIDAIKELYDSNSDFVKAVSQATNNSASVQKRVGSVFNMLMKLAG